MNRDNIHMRTQITFTSWDGEHITGCDNHGNIIHTTLPAPACYQSLPMMLQKGNKLNILSATRDSNNILHPRDIIFEPDYLIDISALARCVQPYGSPAIGYILNLFENNEDSAARLLGEAANMFLDDCVNESPEAPATYETSLAAFFREYALQLSVCKGIDHNFFAQALEQFHHIKRHAGRNNSESNGYNADATLEPSFFCEALGLQGRIDLLMNNDSLVIELKSGKCDEYRRTAKEEHRMQMSLYKEMLHYCMEKPRNAIQARLFYSRYPRFYNEECTTTAISNALMLRNNIVSLLIRMGGDALRPILEHITPDDLNEQGTASRLWNDYQRPRIENILLPITHADTTMREYIFGNMAFVAREMQLAKTGGIKRHDSGRSFADVWNMPLETKKDCGNILTELSIKEIKDDGGVSDITFAIPPSDEGFFPNFRNGDTVFMYLRTDNSHTATNRQVMRGTLTSITPTEATLHLRHKQRNRSLFDKEALYAIEHDHLDSTFRASLRDLYSLLSAPAERTDLLLCRRAPRFDRSRTLNGDYGDTHLNSIVLQAKQADDLFMLVGPPGTGKTSQALSSMVREYLTEKNSNILLVSYTNRAVDEICQALDRMPEAPEYIRIGSEQSCLPQYRRRLLKNATTDCKKREQIINLMHKTRIFVGTVASITARKELFKLKRFDCAIIDEATQILESQLAGLLAATHSAGTSAIGKFILIGDPKQLPAVVVQPHEASRTTIPRLNSIGITDFSVSLFERMYRYTHNNPIDGLIATLYRQGRMHPEVSNFANRHFYGDTLHPIPLPHQCGEETFEHYDSNDSIQNTIATRRTSFIPTASPRPGNNPKTNCHEAELIARFIDAYYRLHVANEMPCNPSEEIGIIVPFRNQIAMVTQAIATRHIPQTEGIIIDTVERFQGSQREMILFGTTVWRRDMMETLSCPVPDADGTLIDRKLNVALTRARRRMYIFGNPETLSASPLYKALIEELQQ